MNVNLDAARLPAGLLVAAALLQFAPSLVTPVALVAYAIAAWLAAGLKLKGITAALAIVVAVVGLQLAGFDLGVQPIRDLADQTPDIDAPNLGQLTGGVGQ